MGGEWIFAKKKYLTGGQISKSGAQGGDCLLIISSVIIYVDNLPFIHMLFQALHMHPR